PNNNLNNNNNPLNDINNNLNTDKEEEKNNYITNENYKTIFDLLVSKNIDEQTAEQTIQELYNKGITSPNRQDILKQFDFMMNKVEYNQIDSHKNFAVYFANGVELQALSRQSNESHHEFKQREQEMENELRKKINRNIYYDWLNEK